MVIETVNIGKGKAKGKRALNQDFGKKRGRAHVPRDPVQSIACVPLDRLYRYIRVAAMPVRVDPSPLRRNLPPELDLI